MDLNPDPGEGLVSQEQLRYADWLDAGTRIGLCLLVASFALYASGLVDPHVRLSDLASVWVLPVDRYLAVTGLPAGWGWLGYLGASDVMNFIGIAFLSLVTLGCYARLAVSYLRQRDTACALIVLAEIAVLVIAASGLVSGGH